VAVTGDYVDVILRLLDGVRLVGQRLGESLVGLLGEAVEQARRGSSWSG